MKSGIFIIALSISIAIGIYAGQKHLFYTDYFNFMIVFSVMSLIVSVAALITAAASLEPTEEDEVGPE